MLLTQVPGELVQLRLVVISDLLINTLDLDLDTAALAASTARCGPGGRSRSRPCFDPFPMWDKR